MGCSRQAFDEYVSGNNTEFESLTRKVHSENENLKRGIHDLDEKISNLDDENRSIQSDIQ